jgi:uncharacterized protein (DUF1800 family)
MVACMLRKFVRWSVALAVVVNLAACPLGAIGPADAPQSREDAWRFLNQASFGPSEADISHLSEIGYSAWIDEQLAMNPAMSYRAYFEARDKELSAGGGAGHAGATHVLEAFYTRALTDKAQLKNRVALALSEIFVVSFVDKAINEGPALMVGYLDLLDNGVSGNYRSLLGAISTSPAMGQYLSFRSNNKEDTTLGRTPDENYAREVMQLFSIGLYQLNGDGSLKLDGAGKPIETYSLDDVKGLAKVFTGWGNYHGSSVSSAGEYNCFFQFPVCADPEGQYRPMVPFATFHSTSEKRFLGTSIGAQNSPDAAGDMQKALDVLANHPNTAPNFSRQLIQRLVTSNPSPAYVQRVADRFVQTQGQIGEVVKAILLDPDARSADTMMAPDQGKLREPILRLTTLLRAFKFKAYGLDPGTVTSVVPHVDVGVTSDAGKSLGQTPFYAPSVFNFFRPGYVVPLGATAQMGLVAPEFQLVSETSVTGYVNTIKALVTSGIGPDISVNNVVVPSVQLDVSGELAMAYDAATLIDHIANRLQGGYISAQLSQVIKSVLDTMPVPAANADQSNGEQINAALDQRVRATIMLMAVSPEFLIQR